MKRDLVEGYLFEVTKSLPRKDRKEIYEKLEPEIYEKIELRKKDNIETKEEVLSVLEEYGDPADVAVKYSHRGKRALVPQPHYAHFVRDKGLAYFIAILAILGINAFFYLFVEEFSISINEILRVLANLGTAILIIYITYTVSFSWVSSSRLGDWKKFAKGLRSEPKGSSRAGAFEIYFQVVVSSLLLVVFGISADLLGLNYSGIVIDTNFIIGLFVPILFTYFLNVLNIAYKEVDRRYTFGVLFTTLLTNLAIVGMAFLIFVRYSTISASFSDWLREVMPANDITLTLFNNLDLVIFLVVVLFAAIDLFSTAMSYHSDKKASVEPIRRGDKAVEDEDGIFSTSEEFKDESYHSIDDIPVEDVVITTPEDLEVEEVIVDTPVYSDEPLDVDEIFVEENTHFDEEVIIPEPIILDADGEIIDDELSETKIISRTDMNEFLSDEDLTNETAPKTIADHIRDANPDRKK